MNKRITVVLSWLGVAGCSGGGSLTGDGGEDARPDMTDAPEAGDPSEDIAEVPDTQDIATDDPDVLACVQTYSGCACEPGCVDGFSETIWYDPADGGPFPSDTSPTPELLAIGVARYQCSVCSCGESWSIRDGESWRDVGVLEMCERIVSQDRACGGCLETWWGGCC